MGWTAFLSALSTDSHSESEKVKLCLNLFEEYSSPVLSGSSKFFSKYTNHNAVVCTVEFCTSCLISR